MIRNRVDRQKKSRSRQHGFSLISALCLLFIAAMLGLTLASVSVSSFRLANYRRDGQKAFNYADAGLQHAASKLEGNASYAGETNTPIDSGKFSISLATPGGLPLRRIVTSTGSETSFGNHVVQRTVMGVVEPAPSRIFGYSIAVQNAFNPPGNILTDSFPKPNAADVHSNTSIMLSGGSVAGGVSAVGTASTNGGATAAEGYQPNSPSIEMPTFDYVALENASMANGNFIGNRSFAAGAPIITGRIQGNLSLTGTATPIFVGPVYVTGTVTMTCSKYGGDGVVISGGRTTLGNGASFNGTETNSLAIISRSASAIDGLLIKSDVKMRGFLYCPNGTVKNEGNFRIWGTIAAKGFNMQGDNHLTFDTNMLPPPILDQGMKVRGWVQK